MNKFTALFLLLISSFYGYSQFDKIKNDTLIKKPIVHTKTYSGITEINSHKVFFKSENSEIFHDSPNKYRLVFSWWDLRNNRDAKLSIYFNKNDIKDLVHLLEITLNRTDDCEYKSKKFHIGKLGQRIIFFQGAGYTNISQDEGNQIKDFLNNIK